MMNINENTKILLFATLVGLFWSSPALRVLSVGGATQLEVWLSVAIRVAIVYGVTKFVISLVRKSKN